MTYYSDPHVTLHRGDALDVLRTLPSGSVDCAVTSPPYACPPGGTVLDLFGGSASTLVAVRHLGQGRKGVAYEVREEQCETAARRLSQGVLDFGEAAE